MKQDILDQNPVDVNPRCEYIIHDDLGIAVIARAVCTDDGENVIIDLINVNRGFRYRGLGTQLLNQIVKEFNHKNLLTSTWSYLVPWYEKHGFEVTGHNNGIYFLERNAVL